MPIADTYKAYTGLMWSKLSALATWQPDVRLAVGDVVSAGAGGVVTRETSLADLGVSAARLTHTRLECAPVREHSGVQIHANASAGAGQAVTARAAFSKDSSFLVVTPQGWMDTASQMADVRALVDGLHASGVWQPGWHLVTTVRMFPACTIVIAKSAGVEVEVSVDAAAAGVPTPGDVRAGFAVSVNSDHVSYWATQFDTTPLYEAIGMKRHGIRRRQAATQVEYLTRDDGSGEPDLESDRGEVDQVWSVRQSEAADLGLL